MKEFWRQVRLTLLCINRGLLLLSFAFMQISSLSFLPFHPHLLKTFSPSAAQCCTACGRRLLHCYRPSIKFNSALERIRNVFAMQIGHKLQHLLSS